MSKHDVREKNLVYYWSQQFDNVHVCHLELLFITDVNK